MGPEALAQVLRPLTGLFEADRFPNLLRGLDVPDDGAVWKLDDERALILTSDFFPPVVDDPLTYGAISAANALSDVYAMGGRPLLAINLAAFPDELDGSILSEILRGGAQKVLEAGAVIAGGHTTSDKEPKYGLAVVGMVHPDRLLTNGGAQPGDRLFLTKPLGTGLITTAAKNDAVDPADLQAAIDSMSRLSGPAAELLGSVHPAVHAATDVTGFGLVGHGHELALASGCRLEIRLDSLPQLPNLARYVAEGRSPGGARRNRNYYGTHVDAEDEIGNELDALIYDPQTSGPLLFAVAAGDGDRIAAAFRAAGEPCFEIGVCRSGTGGRIVLRR